MNKAFLPLSKNLSRRILMISLVTITVITVVIVWLAVGGQRRMTDAFLEAELQAANTAIGRAAHDGMAPDRFFEMMKRTDEKINERYPLVPDDMKKRRGERVWIYSIVIDSLGYYVHHPERQRVGKGNFFDDIKLTPTERRQELIDGLASGKDGIQLVTVDGEKFQIYYAGVKGTDLRHALIVPREGQMGPTLHVAMIILGIIALGLLVAYWMSRLFINRAIKPLQRLAGSADEIAKGNFQGELPELKQNDEISVMRDSFANMQQSLVKYIDELKETTAEKAAFEKELRIAREIQLSMVPTTFPESPYIDIYATMTPARAVGGDLYDFYLSGNRLYFCIGDVSGKGIPAALLMMETKSLFRAYSRGEQDPHVIVTQINQDLNANNEACMFVTLFLGILDLSTGELRYCNAGHKIPLIIDEDVRELPVNPIFPIGLVADTPYQTQTAAVKPGTTILLYTDGLDEAMDAENNQMGEERVLEEARAAAETRQTEPKAVIERMRQTASDYVGDTEQSDDLTLMAIKFLSPLLLLIALFCFSPLHAQSRDKLKRERADSVLSARYYKTPYDTNYVVRPEGKLTLKLRLNQTGNTFHAKGHVDGVESKADLSTSHKTTVSIGASYLGLSASFSLNPAKMRGSYHDYELNLNYYSSCFSVDFSYQRSNTLSGANIVMNNSLFDDSNVVVNQNKWRARAFFGLRLFK